MPTLTNPTLDAAEAREALRALAHATQRLDDPRALYAILGDLTSAAASLSQVLHQLGATHEAARSQVRWRPRDSRDARASRYQISWDLHRAGEILRQVASCIADAHAAEGTITYEHHDLTTVTSPRPERDLSR